MQINCYMVTTKDHNKWLATRKSKYGTTISLTKTEMDADRYLDEDDARNHIVAYLSDKETIDASSLEIVQVIIEKKVLRTIRALPFHLEYALLSWGWTKETLTEELIKEGVIKKYKIAPKSFSVSFETRSVPLYQGCADSSCVDIEYVILDNIIWEPCDR